MNDDVPDRQPASVEAGSVETEVLLGDNEDYDSEFEDVNTSTDPVDNEAVASDGRDAALTILEDDYGNPAHQVLGVESHREVTPGHVDQHQDPYESVEANLELDDQLRNRSQADVVNPDDNHELQNHDVDMANNTPHEAASASAAQVYNYTTSNNTSDPSQSEPIDEDPSSLFVPEHSPPSHSVPVPSPPRSSTTPAPPTPTFSRPPGATPDKRSVFARMKDMQRIARERMKASNQRAAWSRRDAEPDSQAYSATVMSGTTSGTATYPVDEDELVHRQALAEYDKQKRHYEAIRLQHNGRLPFREDVEWMRIKGAEDARRKKLIRDRAKVNEDDEPDLFPPIFPQTDELDEDAEGISGGHDGSRKRRRREQPRKQTQNISMQDAELQAMYVALEADEDAPKKKTKKGDGCDSEVQDSQTSTNSKASKSKSARPSRAKTTGRSAPKGSRKTAKDKRQLEIATRQATSLFNANVFEEQAGMDAADQPVFKSKAKRDALKELIASVPIQDKKQARNDMNSLIQASKDFDGYGACRVAGGSGNWTVKGMKTSLKGYQVLGSAFMRRRENDEQEPKGGLMADQMGLGKTLMMLANIVNSRDAMIRTRYTGTRTTLLVASPALLTQWAAEIQQHTNCDMKVIRYGAGMRVDSTDAKTILEGHDIVLTTYSEVMRSYPKNNPPIECQTAEQKIAWWKEVYMSHRGILHTIKFKRVVLDEAQAIKNHTSRTSIACRALMAAHKWALSGTPILNRLDELYPYFKFLNVPHTGSFKIFKNNYCGNGDVDNSERLLVRLSQFMIRRTHADRMFNAPILKLPQANQSTHWCEFNSVERCIYIIVHQRFAKNINMLAEKGTLERSYSNVLVMLLRLRQLTAHVLMLQFVMRDLLEREDIERIKEVVKEQAATSHAHQGRTILAIRKQLEAHELREKKKTAAKAARRIAAEAAARAANEEYEEPEFDEDDFEDDDDAPVEGPNDKDAGEGAFGSGLDARAERNKSGRAFGKSYDFKPFVNSLSIGEVWEQKKEKAKCGECGKRPHNPWMTACGHIMCDYCYEEVMHAAAELGNPHGTCKACGQTFHVCTPIESQEDEEEVNVRGTRAKMKQKKMKEKERLDREDIAEDWLSLGGDEVLPSAKTIAIKAQILNWIRENPSVKIIVYTQFLAMIRILAKVCQQEGWRSEQYHGKLSLKARDNSIKEFADNQQSRVLLASLQCGGLGLNLTMASKVIIIDPWWNQASEQQAFCRVFRIGQQDETFMSRMCVKNTVDERLIQMQKKKQKEIDEVMDDRGRRIKKLDITDLMRLFGNIEEGEDGKPIILVDNPDAAGGFYADADHEGYADES